jgi:hypothetical protein
LKWARRHGCPWDHFTVLEATMNGFFDLLEWAEFKGCPRRPLRESNTEEDNNMSEEDDEVDEDSDMDDDSGDE